MLGPDLSETTLVLSAILPGSVDFFDVLLIVLMVLML